MRERRRAAFLIRNSFYPFCGVCCGNMLDPNAEQCLLLFFISFVFFLIFWSEARINSTEWSKKLIIIIFDIDWQPPQSVLKKIQISWEDNNNEQQRPLPTGQREINSIRLNAANIHMPDNQSCWFRFVFHFFHFVHSLFRFLKRKEIFWQSKMDFFFHFYHENHKSEWSMHAKNNNNNI